MLFGCSMYEIVQFIEYLIKLWRGMKLRGFSVADGSNASNSHPLFYDFNKRVEGFCPPFGSRAHEEVIASPQVLEPELLDYF